MGGFVFLQVPSKPHIHSPLVTEIFMWLKFFDSLQNFLGFGLLRIRRAGGSFKWFTAHVVVIRPSLFFSWSFRFVLR